MLSSPDLGLRLCSGRLQSSRAGGSAAAGLAATREYRAGEMIRQTQFSGSDENQEFCILERIRASAEGVSRGRDIRESGQAGDGTSLLHIRKTADQGRFVLLDAYGLRQRAIGDDRNPVHAGAR